MSDVMREFWSHSYLTVSLQNWGARKVSVLVFVRSCRCVVKMLEAVKYFFTKILI